jgi:hypothetical protein
MQRFSIVLRAEPVAQQLEDELSLLQTSGSLRWPESNRMSNGGFNAQSFVH